MNRNSGLRGVLAAVLLVSVGALAPACSSDNPGGDEGFVPFDFSKPVPDQTMGGGGDGTGVADMTMPKDLAGSKDSNGGGGDMAGGDMVIVAGADMTVVPDMTVVDLVTFPDLTPCVSGAACTPSFNCHVGKLVCDNGVATCMDTGAKQPDGTACGKDSACFMGICAQCKVGADCVPKMGCHKGKTDCVKGQQVCNDTGANAPDGQNCGSNLYCYMGVCQFCAPNMSCKPSGGCKTGITSCTTGLSVCKETGLAQNGTSCGMDLYCHDGTCTPCKVGTSCMTNNLCRTATVQCSTGQPVCVETGDVKDGTMCGTDKVCMSGMCGMCQQGAPCKPTNVCHIGAIDCATGAPVCKDTLAEVMNGTTCGTNMYCHDGSCTACDTSESCTINMGCKSGKISCTTGAPVCAATTSKPNGTMCATDHYCYFGNCIECHGGGSCVPMNPCHVGMTDCSTGVPNCVDTGKAVGDGQLCGLNMKCVGGNCK